MTLLVTLNIYASYFYETTVAANSSFYSTKRKIETARYSFTARVDE